MSSAWRDNAPGKLVGLLSSTKSTPEMLGYIHDSLKHHVDVEEERLSTLVSLTMHYCTNCGSEEHAYPIFAVLAKVMPMWESSNIEFLKILPDAYAVVPRTVVATMDLWTMVFLDTKQVLRDEAAKWLQEKVFVDPISGHPDLDADRARQARKLVKTADMFLRDMCNKERARSRFEGAIQLLITVGNYLQTLQVDVATHLETAERDVNVKLRTEVDEIPQTLVVLKDLDTEVLSFWQDAVGVMQGVSQDVRASVEASEDFASSDDWDEDDDESVALD